MFRQEQLEDIVGKFGIDIYNEESTNLIEDAIQIIFKSYRKILKFDILNDTYETIKLQEENSVSKLSEWLKMFIATGNIYYQDIKDLLEFMSPSNLQSYFIDKNSKKKVFRYRRLCSEGQFRWVALYVFPSSEFTKENQIVYLCIRDIQDDYDYQLSEQRKIAYLSTHDAITGYKNTLAYMNDACDFDSLHINSLIRIKRILPQSEEVEDSISKIESIHKITTSLRKRIPNEIAHYIYAFSENEFVILFSCTDNTVFTNIYNSISTDIIDNALIGYSFYSSPMININKLLFEAEDMMYGEEE